ncbi:MAG: glycosyltransferase family 39 protein [Acidimicrobiia bacterium]|nr:glycosyltransferase family 39 protein [Acidimicrobiia bacterium]
MAVTRTQVAQPQTGDSPPELRILTNKRLQYLAMGIVAVVGVALRFAALDELGVNSDEAVYSGQAASLAGIERFLDDFSPFRAHPLLFQFTLSLLYRLVGFTDVGGRIVAACFGLLTVAATFAVGQRIFSKRIGLLGALAVAVMPYHVVVSRQALLEAAMTLFFTLTMYALVRYREIRTAGAAAFVGIASGLTFMSKEVGILVLVILAVVVLVEGGYRVSHLAIGLVAFIFTVSPHLVASGIGAVESEAGGAGWVQYLIWQLGRPPNHPGSFYLSNALHYFGLPLALLAIIGGVLLTRTARRNGSHNLLIAWVLVPLLFFQVWKVKGYHYIVEIAPAVAILAALVLDWLWTHRRLMFRRSSVVLGVVAFTAMIWISAVNGPLEQNYARVGDAGYSGIPGGKEAALWIRDNTPEGARLLGIGPSLGNIVRFYADADVDALSVSPNPVRTNPAYEAVSNPDYQLRWGLYDYIVYDVYSAQRTAHFANRLLDFIGRYGGELVYEDTSIRIGEDGEPFSAPIIRIYRLKPVGQGAGA